MSLTNDLKERCGLVQEMKETTNCKNCGQEMLKREVTKHCNYTIIPSDKCKMCIEIERYPVFKSCKVTIENLSE